MSLRDKVREQLGLVTQADGKVPKRVLFARLLFLFGVAIWDLLFLMVAFTVSSAFSEYLDSKDVTDLGCNLMVGWSLVTTVIVGVVVMVKAYSRFGIWEKRQNANSNCPESS